jgi:hypothetical protein
MEKQFADLFDSECEETSFDNNNSVEQVSTKRQNALTGYCGHIWEGAKAGCSNFAEAAR